MRRWEEETRRNGVHFSFRREEGQDHCQSVSPREEKKTRRKKREDIGKGLA